MKKLLTLTLLLATLLTLSACDDKNEPEDKNPFVGTWTDRWYRGANKQHWDDYEITIKSDGTAEQIIRHYTAGDFSSIEMHDLTYVFDESESKPTIYLYYLPNRQERSRIKGVIVGEHLYISLSDFNPEEGRWIDYNQREYTKQ